MQDLQKIVLHTCIFLFTTMLALDLGLLLAGTGPVLLYGRIRKASLMIQSSVFQVRGGQDTCATCPRSRSRSVAVAVAESGRCLAPPPAFISLLSGPGSYLRSLRAPATKVFSALLMCALVMARLGKFCLFCLCCIVLYCPPRTGLPEPSLGVRPWEGAACPSASSPAPGTTATAPDSTPAA